MGTVSRSPTQLRNASPASSPASSTSSASRLPSAIRMTRPPSADPSNAATDRPRTQNLPSAAMMPTLSSARSQSRSASRRSTERTRTPSVPVGGSWFASSASVKSSLPSPTPNPTGSNFPMPSFRRKSTTTSLNGTSPARTEAPRYCTSALTCRQASPANGPSGRTYRSSPWARPSSDAAIVPSASEPRSTPKISPKSSMSSESERRRPVSRGGDTPASNCSRPRRSLSPTVPSKFDSDHRPSSSPSRPDSSYRGNSGNGTPSNRLSRSGPGPFSDNSRSIPASDNGRSSVPSSSMRLSTARASRSTE